MQEKNKQKKTKKNKETWKVSHHVITYAIMSHSHDLIKFYFMLWLSHAFIEHSGWHCDQFCTVRRILKCMGMYSGKSNLCWRLHGHMVLGVHRSDIKIRYWPWYWQNSSIVDWKNEQIQHQFFFFLRCSTSYICQRQCITCWKNTSCCLTNFLLVYSQVQLLCFILESCLQDVALTHITFLCWLAVSPAISC